jgi:stalled ribosome rescue protein Dom34
MSTFHAVVWIDHTEAHVAMFDKAHVETQRIRSRSHHKHQGKGADLSTLFGDVANTLVGCQEILLTGPGLARQQFRDWCIQHHRATAARIVDSVPTDHPSDAQLVAMAKQYFKKFDNMAADPSLAS